MTASATATRAPSEASRLGPRILRVVGWTLIAAGMVVLLYLVYALLFTNLETSAAQSSLADQWSAQVGELDSQHTEVPVAPAEDEVDEPEVRAVDPGGAVAALEFRRAGSGEPVVREEPLYVVAGVTRADLTRGPGHYPGTALPGEEGNFAVAGHRTTYGAPFFHLDRLEPGDEVRVTARDGSRHRYRVVDLRIVSPSDAWVLGPDPLETGRPTLTLTTCHPRFSAAQRLVVFAEIPA